MAQKDGAAKTALAKEFPLLGAVIGKVVAQADSWQGKKVKKTGICVGLFSKAAKALTFAGVEAEFTEEPKAMIARVGVELIKQIETAIEKDNAMSNLKGKIKEIKKIIEA